MVSVARARGITLVSASVLLIALSAVMLLASPAVGTLGAAGAAMAVAVWAVRGGATARWAAVATAATYGVLVAFIVSTPLRQPTPPPGQIAQPIDAGGAVLAAGFVVAAILFALGERDRRN